MNKGAVFTMVAVGALLLGFGVWQFGSLPLAGGGHEDGEHEGYEDEGRRPAGEIDPDALLQRIGAEYGAHVIEVEREREDGRSVLEVKLDDGREVLVDPVSGEVLKTN